MCVDWKLKCTVWGDPWNILADCLLEGTTWTWLHILLRRSRTHSQSSCEPPEILWRSLYLNNVGCCFVVGSQPKPTKPMGRVQEEYLCLCHKLRESSFSIMKKTCPEARKRVICHYYAVNFWQRIERKHGFANLFHAQSLFFLLLSNHDVVCYMCQDASNRHNCISSQSWGVMMYGYFQLAFVTGRNYFHSFTYAPPGRAPSEQRNEHLVDMWIHIYCRISSHTLDNNVL